MNTVATIGITGYRSELGKALGSYFEKQYTVEEVDCINDLDNCNVFINCKYSYILQENYLSEIFEKWKDRNSLIINIVSSSVLDEIPFHESFVRYKTRLTDKAHKLCNDNLDKKLRITNLYPFTLSSNKSFDTYNKVDINKIVEIVDWLIKQPTSIELRDISIYPTTIEKQFKKDKLL